MNEVFVVRNQLAQYWGKQKKWVDGTDPRRVQIHKHEDEAVNQLVELSARDIDLRGEVISAELNERKIPQVEPSEHLIVEEVEPPMAQEQADSDSDQDSSCPATDERAD